MLDYTAIQAIYISRPSQAFIFIIIFFFFFFFFFEFLRGPSHSVQRYLTIQCLPGPKSQVDAFLNASMDKSHDVKLISCSLLGAGEAHRQHRQQIQTRKRIRSHNNSLPLNLRPTADPNSAGRNCYDSTLRQSGLHL